MPFCELDLQNGLKLGENFGISLLTKYRKYDILVNMGGDSTNDTLYKDRILCF